MEGLFPNNSLFFILFYQYTTYYLLCCGDLSISLAGITFIFLLQLDKHSEIPNSIEDSEITNFGWTEVPPTLDIVNQLLLNVQS
jgi:hypothetical protein